MRGIDWFLSLAIHGMVIGTAAFSLSRAPSASETEPIPIYFEIVEASTADPADQPAGPPSEASVPPQAEPDSGSVPLEAPPVERAPVPISEEGSVPLEETVEVRKDDEASDERDGLEAPAVAMDDVPPDETASVERSAEQAVMERKEAERAKVVAAPFALNRIVPVYPRSARRKGHEGCVTVAVTVAEDGGIVQAAVVASSGYGELDAAALAAVRSARFAPATAEGVRVRGELRLTFDFRLR